jgi:thiamine biosynthesis protein ThiS
MNVTINREPVEVEAEEPTIRGFLKERGIPEEGVVVAINGDVVPRGEWGEHTMKDGDEIEIVHAVAGGSGEDTVEVAGETFYSRLFLGTGKYSDAIFRSIGRRRLRDRPSSAYDPAYRGRIVHVRQRWPFFEWYTPGLQAIRRTETRGREPGAGRPSRPLGGARSGGGWPQRGRKPGDLVEHPRVRQTRGAQAGASHRGSSRPRIAG